jgi:hypothetical protein
MLERATEVLSRPLGALHQGKRQGRRALLERPAVIGVDHRFGESDGRDVALSDAAQGDGHPQLVRAEPLL